MITIATIQGNPTLLIDRPPATTDPTPPAAVTTGMAAVTAMSPTSAGRHDAIPLAAIASWRTLLGTTSDEETVAAILHVRDHGEPDPDPETGRNAWTSAYEQVEHDLLADRNQVSAALYRARTRAGAIAVDGRAETRRLLGLPGTPIGYETEAATAIAALADEPAEPDTSAAIPLPADVDATMLASLLTAHADQIVAAGDRFEESLTHDMRKDR